MTKLPLPESIRTDINERQEALNDVQVALEKEARALSRRAVILRIAVIFLGAFVATREAADKLWPPTSYPTANWWVILIYTLLAVLIAFIGGIAAAFRYENRAADLKILAAECNSHKLIIDCKIPMEGDASSDDPQIKAARELIDLQNEKLSELQDKAARTGMNITRTVRKITTKRAQQL